MFLCTVTSNAFSTEGACAEAPALLRWQLLAGGSQARPGAAAPACAFPAGHRNNYLQISGPSAYDFPFNMSVLRTMQSERRLVLAVLRTDLKEVTICTTCY
ncbi:hypothetical protein AV530_000831 [Patagioenas fasciata monilis]|uniref:Uncharacterized protein n=1 Tax=Patagioenas fasciata monilis TaxID=372326 RepID=A0A1V4KSH1_PATFA|nr:hypothetical protein AV530_000831 [Patagioenas fasciata monilis]